MTRGIKVLIACDVINTYSDVINERIRETNTRHFKLYVGDFVNYTFQLFKNNGWNPKLDSPDEVYAILKSVLCLCFQANGIDGTAEWSDDMNYICVI